jgi:hypothetical protein
MPANAANFADAVVATAPSPATSGLSLTVATGYGARFSAASFNAAIGPGNVRPSLETHELVTVSSRTDDVFTIFARGIEGTTPRAIVAGDVISQLPTAADWLALVATYDSATWTGNHIWEQSIAANTTAAAQRLVNPAAATAGNQRFSPATQWEGSGWDPFAAASRSVRFRSYVQPVQSNGLNDSKFIWQASIDGGAWDNALSIKAANAGGTLEGNTWEVFNLTVNGTMQTSAISGLFTLGMIDNGAGLFSYTFAFVDSVGASADHNFIIDPRDGDRTLSLGGDLTTGNHALTLTTTGTTNVTLPTSGTLATLADVAGLSLTTVEVAIATTALNSGTFDVTGLSGLTAGKAVIITQAAAAYTGKGDLVDESEMDMVSATAYVLNSTTIRAFWQSCVSPVLGNFKFNYTVSA